MVRIRRRNDCSVDGRRASGYTLVELMIVLMIVAVLIGLITFAVQQVRKSADRAVCMNNLKQIAHAVLTYHELQDRFPTYNGIGTPKGADMSQSADSKAVYGSYLTHMLPYLGQKELYNGIQAEANQYTNTGKVLRVEPGTPAIPPIPGTPGKPGKAPTPAIPAFEGSPEIPAIPGTLPVAPTPGGPIIKAEQPYVPAVYDYTGLEYRNASPLTYNQWNATKYLVDYYVDTPTGTNGAVISVKYSRWEPAQFPDPGSGQPAGYYRTSDGSGPVSPPIKTPAIPYSPAVYGPPGAPTPGSPGTPGQAAIPARPPTPYIPADPGYPAIPGTPDIPGVPAGPNKNIYTSTFKAEFRGQPIPVFRCPSDMSVGTDPNASAAGFVYTATNGVDGAWTSTNYLANWNVFSVHNAEKGYKALPSNMGAVIDGPSNTIMLAEAYAWCDGKGRTALVAWHENDPYANVPNGGLNVGGVHNFGLTYQLTNNMIQAGNRPAVGVTAANGFPNPSGTPELIFEFQVMPKPLPYAQCPPKTECCVAFTVQSGHMAGLHAAAADGSVHTLRREMTLDVWRALLLPSDGKSFASEW